MILVSCESGSTPSHVTLRILVCGGLADDVVGHLENTHAKGVAEDLVSIMVEAVADVGGGHEEREGVLLLGVQQPPLHHLLDLSHALLAVTAQSINVRCGTLPDPLYFGPKQP